MKIEVTQTMIDEGEACSCFRCPVAIAIKRASADLTVGFASAWIDQKQVHLPDDAMDFVNAFDGGNPVRPFSFELDYEN